jgi:hypothetical protein
MYAYTDNVVAGTISIYPNPATGPLNLSITPPLNTVAGIQPASPDELYAIKIVNSSGAVIKSASTNERDWQTDVSSLKPGIYVIQVVKSDHKAVGRGTFIKL